MRYLKSIKLISVLLALLFCLAIASPCLAVTGNYQLSEVQMIELLRSLDRLESYNNRLSSDLKNSKSDLSKLQEQLTVYKNNLALLKEQLNQSQILSATLRESLVQANERLNILEESYKVYQKEVRSRIRKLTIERNILAIIASLLAIKVYH